jgi:hypothetical protein
MSLTYLEVVRNETDKGSVDKATRGKEEGEVVLLIYCQLLKWHWFVTDGTYPLGPLLL